MTTEQKRLVRREMEKIIALRRKQRDGLYAGLIQPIVDNIKMTKDVQQGKIPLEHWLKHNKQIETRINEFFGEKVRGEKNGSL
jgi:Zn-dependent alcohol dehydrogenase